MCGETKRVTRRGDACVALIPLVGRATHVAPLRVPSSPWSDGDTSVALQVPSSLGAEGDTSVAPTGAGRRATRVSPIRRRRRRRAASQIVLLDLAVERALADAEDLGGLLAVAVDELERVADQLLLGLLDADADEVVHAAEQLAAAARA